MEKPSLQPDDSRKCLDQAHAPPTYQPLRDMGLHTSNKSNHDHEEFGSIQQHHLTMPKQQHIENWLDGSEFEPSMGAHHGNHGEFHEPITAMTIHRLEEQIQLLRVKVEDINARLENVTSILQETHPGNVNHHIQSIDYQYCILLGFVIIVRCDEF